MGHSMGGMLAMRYALMFPRRDVGAGAGQPDRPGGLEGQGRAARDGRRATTSASSKTIVREHQEVPAGDLLRRRVEARVRPLGRTCWLGMYRGEGGRLVAWNQALTSDMIFTQPVVYELEQISVPTLLHDRPEGHHRHRQGSRPARGRQGARQLRGSWRRGDGAHRRRLARHLRGLGTRRRSRTATASMPRF